MSIELRINATDPGELLVYLRALAGVPATFAPAFVVEDAPAQQEEPAADPKPTASRRRTTKTESADTAPEPDGSTATQVSEPADAKPETNASSSDEAPEQTLDFDRDVTPAVLNCVKAKGKDAVAEILQEFGVAKASQVGESQWGELIARLNDATEAG